MPMIRRSLGAGVVLLAMLASAAQAETYPRIYGLVNRSAEMAIVTYIDYATGKVLLHGAIAPGKSSIPSVPENTEIHVKIERAGCRVYEGLTGKTGYRTFYIYPDCKIESTWSLPT